MLTNTKDSYLLYLGHLYVGDSHRTSGTWPEAVRAYEAAVRAEPEFQTACLSLSHALHRSGYWVLSTEILERCVNLPVDDADYEDGWWRYHLGVSHRAGAILEQWQQEVMK